MINRDPSSDSYLSTAVSFNEKDFLNSRPIPINILPLQDQVFKILLAFQVSTDVGLWREQGKIAVFPPTSADFRDHDAGNDQEIDVA